MSSVSVTPPPPPPPPPPQVQYYGLIKQSPAEDWENTNVSLSTAQPSIGGSAPSLPTRLIRFKRPPPRVYSTSAGLETYRSPAYRSLGYTHNLMYGIEEDEDQSGGQEHYRCVSLSDATFDFKEAMPAPGAPPPPPPPPPAVEVAVAKVCVI